MPIPQLYATDAYVETEAVRNRAGLLDVTSLRLIGVSGKDALAALNEMLISEISKIKPGASSISNIIDDNGSLIDDVLIYCDGPNAYRTSHGGGALEDALPNISAGRDVHLHRDNGTHIVSFQGSRSARFRGVCGARISSAFSFVFSVRHAVKETPHHGRLASTGR